MSKKELIRSYRKIHVEVARLIGYAKEWKKALNKANPKDDNHMDQVNTAFISFIELHWNPNIYNLQRIASELGSNYRAHADKYKSYDIEKFRMERNQSVRLSIVKNVMGEIAKAPTKPLKESIDAYEGTLRALGYSQEQIIEFLAPSPGDGSGGGGGGSEASKFINIIREEASRPEVSWAEKPSYLSEFSEKNKVSEKHIDIACEALGIIAETYSFSDLWGDEIQNEYDLDNKSFQLHFEVTGNIIDRLYTSWFFLQGNDHEFFCYRASNKMCRFWLMVK